ncbi:fatty-acid-binding protein 3, chloroplastic isoform X1 [Rhododendron vialii]|uniref:fatty-acid-binding protein 3, chloroplastic isoform X1 n=1 Tax=Rhododendron vialii TaxID=182163 RepID=UPI00265ED9BD|nr:fatty-acid-binding protein 3, chloroplastic isoform X1 [Rhododendron vialii]
MVGIVATSKPIWLPFPSSPTIPISLNSDSITCFPGISLPNPRSVLHKTHSFPPLSTFSAQKDYFFRTHFSPKAAAAASSSSSVGSPESTEEPATNVKFLTLLSLPGCSSLLSLLGTGYREKVFAIIGVKVYAAGLYTNQSILSGLDAWKGQSSQVIQEDSSLFNTIFQARLEKALQIVLVRDLDGKTFWDALDDAISPRIKSPTPVDESALSTFRSIFQGRPLKKGTYIFLTWLDPTKMLVSVSSGGLPSAVDATIESMNVTSALFDVFFGSDPVSPSLKAAVSSGLATMLK